MAVIMFFIFCKERHWFQRKCKKNNAIHFLLIVGTLNSIIINNFIVVNNYYKIILTKNSVL